MRSRIAVCIILLATILAPGVFCQEAPAQPVPTPPAQSTPKRIRVGGNTMGASIIHQVPPLYPPIARSAHISGTIVLHAIVGKDGTVQDLQFVSGPPLLMKSAMDAVKQWVYKPTLLNGEPVEVDTTISVVFTLDGPPPSVVPRTSSESSIDPQLKADIIHLIETSHLKEKEEQAARAIFESMRPALLSSLPPTQSREKIVVAYSEKLVGLLQSNEFVDQVVAIYAKYFSKDDIKALAQFYETPAGQHYLDAAPMMVADLNLVGQHLAMENMNSIFKQLCFEFPELQGVATFCPQGPSEKKSLLLKPRLPFGAPLAGN